MNIVFKKLELNNFLSFKHALIDLDNQGYTLISGINQNPEDLARENGIGKSALVEALIWVLTGDTIRGTKDVKNRYTDDGASASISFIIDGNNYEITRYKDDKKFGTNLKLYVNTEDKSGKGIRDTEKILSEYLPDLTSELLGSVIVLGQGLPLKFSNNKPSGRKDVLEKLSKSDFMIQDIKDKLTNRKAEINAEIRSLEDSLLESNTKLNVFKSNLSNIEKSLENLKDPSSMIINFDELNESINLLSNDIEDDKLKLNDLEKLLENYQNNHTDLLTEKQKAEAGVTERVSYSLDQLNELIIKTKTNISNTSLEIKKLEAISDICPTCGQKLPDVHKIDTADLHDKLDNLNITLADATKTYQSIIQQRDNELHVLDNSYYQAFKDLDEKINSTKLDKQSLQLSINKNSQLLNDKIKEFDHYKLLVEQYDNEKNKLESQIIELQNDIDALNDKVLYYNINKDKAENHLSIINKMLNIATRDFRGYLLSEVIKFIDSKAKEYSNIIFENNLLDFELDGNDINISYCSKPYENLSGGERQKVDLIIQFSIRDMLTKFLNFSSNILVLDEIFDALDTVGCQKVLDLISNKLSDISSIFIITHHENELAIPYDNKITIVKTANRISEIQ